MSSDPPISYFGLIAGLPPGVPGGGIIGIVAPLEGGFCFIPGSISAGGVITPPERFRSELEVPLAGGTVGVGCPAPGRPLGSSAAARTAPKPRTARVTRHIRCIIASKLANTREVNTAKTSCLGEALP